MLTIVDQSRRKISSTTKRRTSSKEDHVECMVGYWRNKLLNNNQTIIVNLYCDQLLCLETALNQKQPSLVNRKSVNIHHNNACLHTARLTKNLLVGKHYFIHYILLTLLLLVISCFREYRIIWMVLDWHQEKRLKMSWIHILLQNLINFTAVAFIRLLTNGMIF